MTDLSGACLEDLLIRVLYAEDRLIHVRILLICD